MEVLIAALVFLSIAVFIMCFNIIFRKKPFPDGEIGHSKELRKKGIICAKEEEIRLWGRKASGKTASCNGSCGSCGISDCAGKE